MSRLEKNIHLFQADTLPKDMNVRFSSPISAERKRKPKQEITVFINKELPKKPEINLGKKIKEFRKKRKITIDQFTEKGRVLSTKTLTDFESGRTRILRKTAYKLIERVTRFAENDDPLVQEILQELHKKTESHASNISEFAAQIMNFRDKNNISIKVFAEAVGISETALRYIETGKTKNPRKKVVDGIQNAIKQFVIAEDPTAAEILAGKHKKDALLEQQVQKTENPAELFKLFRTQLNLSYDQLAEKSGLSRPTLSRFENKIRKKMSTKVKTGILKVLREYAENSAARKMVALLTQDEDKPKVTNV